jgi:hypothetical protein
VAGVERGGVSFRAGAPPAPQHKPQSPGAQPPRIPGQGIRYRRSSGAT